MRGALARGTDEVPSPSAFDARDAEAGHVAGLQLLDPADPVPFEEVLVPIVVAARARLARRVGAARGALLAAEAHADLEALLLRRLSVLSARSLHVAFTAERMGPVCRRSVVCWRGRRTRRRARRTTRSSRGCSRAASTTSSRATRSSRG